MSVIIVYYSLNVFFVSCLERSVSPSNILKWTLQALHCINSTVFRLVWFPAFRSTLAIRIVCIVNNFTSESQKLIQAM